MTCEQDSAGWPSLQTIPADAIPLAAFRAGGGLSLASLIVIPAKASDPASPFPTRSWPDLIRPSSFTRQMRGSGPAHDLLQKPSWPGEDPAIFFIILAI